MRVLVDTSVWSLALRKGGPEDHPAVRKFSALLDANEDLVLTGLILQEVLQAFRSHASFRRVALHLEPFPLLQLTRDGYTQAARLHRKCASKGIAVATADCQIATAALEHDCYLLTADKNFERIARISPIRLA